MCLAFGYQIMSCVALKITSTIGKSCTENPMRLEAGINANQQYRMQANVPCIRLVVNITIIKTYNSFFCVSINYTNNLLKHR